MATVEDLPTARVTGQFLFVSQDNADAGTAPNAVLVTGYVRFSCTATPPLLYKTRKVAAVPLIADAGFDSEGHLIPLDSSLGTGVVVNGKLERGLELLGDSPDVSPRGFNWQVSFNLKEVVTGRAINIPTYQIHLSAGETVDLSEVMPIGQSNGVQIIRGESAYEVAVAKGFIGTEAQWLEAIRGQDGEPGEPGKDGANVLPTQEAIVREVVDPTSPVSRAITVQVGVEAKTEVVKAIAADGTITEAASVALDDAIAGVDLVKSSDPRMPEHEQMVGLSIALTDKQGNRTHLEANDTDGGPTELSLDLTGPALKEHMGFLAPGDPGVPSEEEIPGASIALVDEVGNRTFLEANDVDGGPTPQSVELLRTYLNTPEGPSTPDVTTYITEGDSITQGGHGGGDNWQKVLSDLMGGTPVTNSGVSGCTGLEIAVKQGSLPPVITVTDGVLPAEAGTRVAVTLDNLPTETNWWSASGQPARAYTGTFDGVPAVLTKSKENTWTLHRTANGAALRVVPRTPFLVNTLSRTATRILWPGRNDYPKSNQREAVDRMAKWITDGGGRFLILSTLTRAKESPTSGDSPEVLEENRITQEAYPYNFVNVRSFMIRHGMEVAGVIPTESDLAAQAADAIPQSLMEDSLHPNAAGRKAIGTYVYQQLKIRNWA